MRERIHIIKKWPCGGGMEAIVRRHLEAGETVVALSGRPEKHPGLTQLSLSPNSFLKGARRALKETLSQWPDRVYLFYNGYAMDWFNRGEIAGVSVLYLHSDYPKLASWAVRLLSFADGCLCVNPGIARKLAPLIPASRIHFVPLPVKVPSAVCPVSKKCSNPVVIGFSGRVEISQKRLDRLPVFIEALGESGIDFRMEILGTGSHLEALRNRYTGNPMVRFHGHLSGMDYWEVLKQWKYIVFFSDYEGLPISLIEGVAAGALPIYPDFHGGEDWMNPLESGSYYDPGDSRAAADRLKSIETSWSDAEWSDYFARARELTGGHTPAAYEASLRTALEEISTAVDGGPTASSKLPSWLPLWGYHRFLRNWQMGSMRREGGGK